MRARDSARKTQAIQMTNHLALVRHCYHGIGTTLRAVRLWDESLRFLWSVAYCAFHKRVIFRVHTCTYTYAPVLSCLLVATSW